MYYPEGKRTAEESNGQVFTGVWKNLVYGNHKFTKRRRTRDCSRGVALQPQKDFAMKNLPFLVHA